MDQQVQQELESKLRDQWSQVYPAILEQFTTVSKADLDSASTVPDIVSRIADRTRYSERFIESRLHELVSSGGGTTSQQQPFGVSGRRKS